MEHQQGDRSAPGGPVRTVREITVVAFLIATHGFGVVGAQSSTPGSERPKAVLGAGLETFDPPPLGEFDDAGPRADEPTGVLRLSDALRAALVLSPRLASYAWQLRAHEAQTLQAGRLSNPTLSLTSEDIAGSGELEGFEAAESTIRLSQVVELGGKRAKRRRLAAGAEQVANWDYEIERIAVFTRTTRLFLRALAAQEELALADELVRIAENSLAKVDQEVVEELADPLDASRARVTLAAARVERDSVRSELLSARSNLAAIWGGAEERFSRVEGDLEALREPPPLEKISSRVEGSPDLRRWAAEIERRQARVTLEHAGRVPDIEPSLGARRVEALGLSAFVVGIDIELPIFDRNRGNELTARYDVLSAEEERRATHADLLALLAAAEDRLRSTYLEATSLRDDVLPQARSVYQRLLAEFDAGRYAYDDVLDSQRTLFRLSAQYLRALTAHHDAVAVVEQLLGDSLYE